MTAEKVRKDGTKEALILKMSDELRNAGRDRLRGWIGGGER